MSDHAKVMRLTAKKILELSQKTMEDAFAASGAMSDNVYDWPAINRYRGLLVDKDASGTITTAESIRLACLNAYADCYVALTAPRPTQVLERAERHFTKRQNPETCIRCKGSGWCWWDELDNWAGHDPTQLVTDDTRYSCPDCDGTGGRR